MKHFLLYFLLYFLSSTWVIAQKEPTKEFQKEDSNFVYVYKKDFIFTGQASKITYRKKNTLQSIVSFV